MVYILYFAFLIIGCFLFGQKGNRKVYLKLIMFFLFLIMGLRDISVGIDTLSYVENFNGISRLSFSEMVKDVLNSPEPLYIILTWIASLFSSDYTLFLLIWALFPVCSMYVVFKEELSNSNDYLIAIIVFFLLGLFAFFVAGIRQTAAISIVMAAAIRMNNGFSQKTSFTGKLMVIIRYILFVGIAYLIHNSSIIALLAIVCLFIRISWQTLLVIITFFFVGRYASLGNMVLVSEILFKDRFVNYGTVYESSLNMSAFFMQLILFIMCMIVKEPLLNRNKQNGVYLTMVLLGLLFQSLSSMIAEMFRVSFYFSIFGIVLVPRAIQEYPKQTGSATYIAFVIAGLVYLFFLTGSNLPEYKFAF